MVEAPSRYGCLESAESRSSSMCFGKHGTEQSHVTNGQSHSPSPASRTLTLSWGLPSWQPTHWNSSYL